MRAPASTSGCTCQNHGQNRGGSRCLRACSEARSAVLKLVACERVGRSDCLAQFADLFDIAGKDSEEVAAASAHRPPQCTLQPSNPPAPHHVGRQRQLGPEGLRATAAAAGASCAGCGGGGGRGHHPHAALRVRSLGEHRRDRSVPARRARLCEVGGWGGGRWEKSKKHPCHASTERRSPAHVAR